MRSKSWDTRVAAGNAVEAIAKNVSIKQESIEINQHCEGIILKY